MHLLKITPLDSLFLGTNKGFSTLKIKDSELKMRNNWYPTNLIPLPSVFYGCISTLYFKHNESIFKTYKRKNKNKKYIKLGRLYLTAQGEDFVPLPSHFCINDVNKVLNLEYIKTLDSFNRLIDDSNKFISLSNLYSYYKNPSRVIENLIDANDILKKSYTVNIETENKVAKDNRLYRKDIITPVISDFNDYVYLDSFSIEFYIEEEEKNNLIQDNGFLYFGGEKKLCKYSIIRDLTHNYNYKNKDIFSTEWVRIVTFSPIKISDALKEDFAHTNIFDKNYANFMLTKKPTILHSFFTKEKKEILEPGTVMYIKNQVYKTMTFEQVYLDIYNKYFRHFYDETNYINYNALDHCKDGFNIFDIFECTLEDR